MINQSLEYERVQAALDDIRALGINEYQTPNEVIYFYEREPLKRTFYSSITGDHVIGEDETGLGHLFKLRDKLHSLGDIDCCRIIDGHIYEINAEEIASARDLLKDSSSRLPQAVPVSPINSIPLTSEMNQASPDFVYELKEKKNMSQEMNIKNALIMGAKLAEGKVLLDALETAVIAAVPEQYKDQLDSDAVRHILRFLAGAGIMHGGEYLKDKWEPLGHLQEVGFMAASVETQQSIDSVIQFVVPFLTQVAKNFMSNPKVAEMAQLPEGTAELINEELIGNLVNGAMKQARVTPVERQSLVETRVVDAAYTR